MTPCWVWEQADQVHSNVFKWDTDDRQRNEGGRGRFSGCYLLAIGAMLTAVFAFHSEATAECEWPGSLLCWHSFGMSLKVHIVPLFSPCGNITACHEVRSGVTAIHCPSPGGLLELSVGTVGCRSSDGTMAPWQLERPQWVRILSFS